MKRTRRVNRLWRLRATCARHNRPTERIDALLALIARRGG
jgi:hypothetical protein